MLPVLLFSDGGCGDVTYFQRSHLNNSIKRTEDSKMGIEREAERGADQ